MASKVRGQPATGQSTTATQSPRSSPAANRQARPSSISTNNSSGTAASQHAPASATAASATASPSPRPSSSTPAANNNAASSSSTADLTSYLGLPVRLKTTTSSNPISGLLFAHDAPSGLVILETGFDPSQNSNSTSSSSGSGYPSKAASAPTTRRHAAVVAAQGGSSDRRPTGFKLIKERTIKEVQVLSNNNDGIYTTSLSPVNVVNPMIAEKREMAATKEATLRASRIGPSGVSDLGQDLFEALSKTLPCRWWEKNIVILDDVVLSEPYEKESLRVPKFSLELLRKLVDPSNPSITPKDLPEGETTTSAKGKARSWERVSRVLEGERRKLAERKRA